MAQSRTNSKSKLTKKSKGNVPKWAIAAVVVLVVAVAGYAIVRFSQAGELEKDPRRPVAGQTAVKNSAGLVALKCNNIMLGKSQFSGRPTCLVNKGKNAEAYWYNKTYYPNNLSFSGEDGVYGKNQLGKLCARLTIGTDVVGRLDAYRVYESYGGVDVVGDLDSQKNIITGANSRANQEYCTDAKVSSNTKKLIGRVVLTQGDGILVESMYLKD